LFVKTLETVPIELYMEVGLQFSFKVLRRSKSDSDTERESLCIWRSVGRSVSHSVNPTWRWAPPEVRINNIYKLGPYFSENTPHLCCKDHLIIDGYLLT